MADSSASPDAGASADVPAVQPTGEGVSAAGGEPASAPTRAAGVAEERKVPTDAYRTVFGEKGKTAIRMACQSFVTVAKKELRGMLCGWEKWHAVRPVLCAMLDGTCALWV